MRCPVQSHSALIYIRVVSSTEPPKTSIKLLAILPLVFIPLILSFAIYNQLPGHNNAPREYLEQFLSTVRNHFPAVFNYVHSLLTLPLQIQLYSPPSLPATVTSKPSQLSPAGLGLLNKIPRTEEQWRGVRTYLGINDDQQILSCLSSIQKCGDNYDSIATLEMRVTEIRKDRESSACLVALTSFLFIITYHLDSADNYAVKSALETFLNHRKDNKDKFRLASRIPKRIIARALQLVTLADSLYHKFQHRTFKILIHIIQPENGAMQYSNIWKATRNNFNLIKSHIHSQNLTDEIQTNLTNKIQASTPFSIIFLLQLQQPTYNLA